MSLPISIKEVPFFKLIIPLLAGIAGQYWFNLFSFSWWNYSILLFFLTATFISFFYSSQWQFRWLFGLIIYLFLFFIGVIITVRPQVHDKLMVSANNKVILYLLDNTQLRTKSIRVEVEIQSINSKGLWWSSREKMLVYFDIRDSLANELQYGDEIAVDIIPQTVSLSGNPKQFDYKKYLSDRGIQLTAYIQPNRWVKVGNNGNAVKRKALALRDDLVRMFSSFGLSGDELAVASALTLGYQDLLDDELRQVYSSSGAMHILSVSGLHVGILYMLFSFLLSFLNGKVITRAVKALILLGFLWFFALITGLPPCVQRSVMMFSFLVVGDFFNQKSNIYNTLAASAFVLLVINPYNLLDIGFQLSYLAVISIVFFYPYIYNMIYTKNWVLDKVWSLIAVSIAAQFGTISLCIFYFHQFPNYFLLSNLVAIPLSSIALCLSVLLIIVSPIPLIAGYVGMLFSWAISLLNHGLEFIERLPYSKYENIQISEIQMFIIIGVVLLFSFFLVSKRSRYVIAALGLIVIYFFLNLSYYIKGTQEKEFVVYNINKKSLVSFRAGKNLVFFDVDSGMTPFAEKYGFFTKGYISSVCAEKEIVIINPSRNSTNQNNPILEIKNLYGVSMIYFVNKSIAIPFNKSLNRIITDHKFEVDYLVINKYCPKRILDFFDPRMVIIDASLSRFALADIIQKCKKYDIPYFIVSAQGAYLMNES